MKKVLLVAAALTLVVPAVPANAQGLGGLFAFLQGLSNPRPTPPPAPPPTGRPAFDIGEQIRTTIFQIRGISPTIRQPVRGR